MNKEESLALYNKGREAWNTWAKELLAQRTKLEETGQWMGQIIHSVDLLIDNNLGTTAWLIKARVDFSEHAFETHVDFTDFMFPGDAVFTEAKFAKKAHFNGATFSGEARFERARFSGEVGFKGAAFNRDAAFEGATFNGRLVDFGEAVFSSVANFLEATFTDLVGFRGATFSSEAWFLKAKFSRQALFGEAKFSHRAWFDEAEFSSMAGFEGATFSGEAEFKEATFIGKAWFEGATFSGEAGFEGAKFSGEAWFERATFTSMAWFGGATFSSMAWFERATFSSYVRFEGTAFRGNTGFNQAIFKGFADFSETNFQKEANFVAIKGQSFFTLEDAVFSMVPDFRQAHFEEAPQLDNTRFHYRKLRLLKGQDSASFKRDVTARWRALKRLAAQGHDHERELIFLAEEIKSLRGVQDWPLPNPLMLRKGEPICWPGAGRYWFGLIYQLCSDFGRSTFRPFLWWMMVMGLFAQFYFCYSITLNPGNNSGATLASLAPLCDPPMEDALYLSLHNGLVISGLGRSEKLLQSYVCLYGGNELGPKMPLVVMVFGIFQTILSAILIFLFLLALRNYFRIK